MSTQPYVAVATSTGDGRDGHVETSDAVLALDLSMPGTGRAGTNPEQLFAAGWSACFHSAMKLVARRQGLTLTDSAVVAEVTLNLDPEAGPSLSAALHAEVSGIDQEAADALVAAAHQVCPYSKATRGNIPVTIDATVA
ncbi:MULTISPECIES: organic hydroperoxide resistance protein [Microbacterium]|uniref:organic hydroperoxide resistance protein n=1 Tax=Microbacterium TaxID=33882 RepID=UPI001E4E9435|nr:organic hydroperoxide resistance protein [Microbacterium nymphoidis]MCD2500108.1 organic hydroperoxide resistance protein [Microbacterium nymphoidis]